MIYIPYKEHEMDRQTAQRIIRLMQRKMALLRKRAGLGSQEAAILARIPEIDLIRYEMGLNDLPVSVLLQLLKCYGFETHKIVSLYLQMSLKKKGIFRSPPIETSLNSQD